MDYYYLHIQICSNICIKNYKFVCIKQSQLVELYEKQDMLNKLTSKEFIQSYGYSEIHCIDLIGKLEKPNVTKISSKLSMTRSAISKIVKNYWLTVILLAISMKIIKKKSITS